MKKILVALMAMIFFGACTKDSAFVGGIEETYVSNSNNGGKINTLILENGYKAIFGTKVAELYTEEQTLMLSQIEMRDSTEVVKTTPLEHSLDLNALFTISKDTVYVSSKEALAKVELQKSGEVSSNVEKGNVDGLTRTSISRGFSFTFNEGEVVEANTLYQKESKDTTEFDFTAIRSVEFETFKAEEAFTSADSTVYDVTLYFIVSLYRNGNEEKIDKYEVEVPYQRIYRAGKADEDEPTPAPGDGDDDGNDDGDDNGNGDDPQPDPTPDPDPQPDPDNGDGNDDGNGDDPQPDPTPDPQPDPDPEPDPTPEPQPEPQPDPDPEPQPQPEPTPAIEKNIPESWGRIIGMGVSAAPADDVQGHYAIWTWCLITEKGAVVATTSEGNMPSVQSFLNGYFVEGNFSGYNGGFYTTEKNNHGLPVGIWAPAQASSDSDGVHYSYKGSNVANVWDLDLEIWRWRGGNYSTYVSGYTFDVDQFGVLYINGQPFAR